MKKTLIVFCFILIICGCAALKQAKVDMYDCLNDQVCLDMAVSRSEAVKKQVTAVAGVASPIPWVPSVAGSLAGSIAVIAFLVAGGRKKREEKEPK